MAAEADKTAAEWHALGMGLLERGDLQEARNHLALALNADSSNVQYMLDYGHAYVRLGQFEKARSFFQAALERDPGSALGNYRLGNLHKQFGQVIEAADYYTRAIATDAAYAEAYNNRGGSYHILGQFEEARADYLKAMELKPGLDEAYLNLGRLLDSSGDFSGAAEIYRRALAGGLNSGLFSHLLDSVSERAGSKAPLGYVKAIFDDYAEAFDQHLTRNLGYSVPAQIGTAVRDMAALRGISPAILDLGCGTGLCGVEVAECAVHLIGVDASPAMLDRADRRGIYHDLVEGDIEQYLPMVPDASVDILIAADVFIYIGDLAGIFDHAARVLRAEGQFHFSIEALEGAGEWQLQRTGRYQHAPRHIESLALQAGLAVHGTRRVDLRLERGEPVPGVLYCLAKRAA